MRTVQPATTYSVILIGHLDKGVVSVFIWRDGKLFCNNSQRTLLVIQQQRCFAGIHKIHFINKQSVVEKNQDK